MNTIYAERLKAALLDRGWSQADLARRTGLDPGHISRYVNGKISPQRTNFRKILDALGMSEREFMSGERFEPDEAQLHLLCEVEILLGLSRRLIEAHKRASSSERPADPERERLLMEATYVALDDKVTEIRKLIRPTGTRSLAPRRFAANEEPAQHSEAASA